MFLFSERNSAVRDREKGGKTLTFYLFSLSLLNLLKNSNRAYAKPIFVDALGADPKSIVNGTPLEDFGGG